MSTPCATDPAPFDYVIDHERATTATMTYAMRAAVAACARCPLTGVDGPCLRDNRDAPGIVAGLTRQQRRRLKHRAPCGTLAAYRRHLRQGEPVDLACSKANAVDKAARVARKKAAA